MKSNYFILGDINGLIESITQGGEFIKDILENDVAM